MYLEWSAGTLPDIPADAMAADAVRSHVTKLREANPGSQLGSLALGVLNWTDGNLKEAKTVLKEALSKGAPHFYGSYALSRLLFQLGELAEAEEAARSCVRLLDSKVKEEGARKTLSRSLSSLLARCLYRQGRLGEVNKVLCQDDVEDNEDEEMTMLRFKVRATFCQSEEEGERLLKDLGSDDNAENEVVRAMLRRALRDTSGAKEHLSKALSLKPNCFEALLMLGKMEEDVTLLLRAAKADPSCPDPFAALGRAYFDKWKASKSQGLLDRARKCLQKAFSLSGGRDVDGADGAVLSDIYRAQGAKDSNMEFLKSVTGRAVVSSGTAAWAFLRLGMLHLEQVHYSHFFILEKPLLLQIMLFRTKLLRRLFVFSPRCAATLPL